MNSPLLQFEEPLIMFAFCLSKQFAELKVPNFGIICKPLPRSKIDPNLKMCMTLFEKKEIDDTRNTVKHLVDEEEKELL